MFTYDIQTAQDVGERHDRPVEAKRMYDEGYKFFLSANGIPLSKKFQKNS